MTDAKRIGRICVWPSYEIALEEDTAVSNVLRRMTVWPSEGLAREHTASGGGPTKQGGAAFAGGGALRPIARMRGLAAGRFAGTGIPSINVGMKARVAPRFAGAGALSVSSPWSPTSLGAQLKAWYPLDRLTGADNDSIGTFADASGHGFTGSNTSTNRPTLRTAFLNSQNVIRCDSAAEQSISFTGQDVFLGMTQGQIFIVFKRDADPPSTTASSGLWYTGSGGNSHWPLTDGTIYDGFGGSVRTTGYNTVSGGVSIASWRIVSVHSVASDYGIFIDGVSRYSTGTNTVGFPVLPTFAQIGANRFSGVNLLGHIAEIIITSAKVSTANREKAEGYLAHKWGLTGNLAGGHPYKSTPP